MKDYRSSDRTNFDMTLIADYSEGGYKDVDIETKISALKIVTLE